MKHLLVAIAFAVTPFIFLYVCVFSLLFYHIRFLDNKPGQRAIYAALPTNQNSFSVSILPEDGRVTLVQNFLAAYGSPLTPYAQDVVDAADQYHLDFRLLPAIAMQESNLCKKIPIGSHNCWGFGIYGKTVTRFPDYKTAIYTVTKTLALKYKQNGLVTPQQIMTMYTPSSNGSWATGVNYFMDTLQ